MLTQPRSAGPGPLPPPRPVAAPFDPWAVRRPLVARPDRALPDRALPDRALPDRALPDREGLLVAVGCGLAFGVLLGCWCRMFAYSVSVNGVLANLASPWVAAAFASGALVARRSSFDDLRPRPRAAGIAGAVAGSICLVVATAVYYGPARTGTFDFGGALYRTVFWAAAGCVIGAIFGATGAVWRTATSGRLRAMCVVLFGAVVVAESCYLIAAGATRSDAFSADVLVMVAIIGLAVPLLLGPRRTGAQGVAMVAMLAVPVSLAGMLAVAIGTLALRVLRAVM